MVSEQQQIQAQEQVTHPETYQQVVCAGPPAVLVSKQGTMEHNWYHVLQASYQLPLSPDHCFDGRPWPWR
jgi:hypothetical protein